MPDATQGLGEFFDYIWGNTKAYVYLPVLNQGRISQYMFEWPRQRNGVIKHVLKSTAEGGDAYYSPALFKEARPLKENVLQTNVLWADFDTTVVDWEKVKNVPAPTLTVESSPGREHAYWRLSEPLNDVPLIEERNRSIAYNLKADTSGWDANQFLRPPFTINTGYGKPDRKPSDVKIKVKRPERVTLADFKGLPSAKQLVKERVDIATLPPINDVIALGSWSEDMWQLFKTKPENLKDRSGALMRLGYLGAENGFSDEQIYRILEHADDRWGKYKNRLDRDKHLLDIINRARQKIGYNFQDNSVLAGLIPELAKAPVKKNSQVVYNFVEFNAADVKIDWLIEKLIPMNGFGLITGPPGLGKTQLGVQFASGMALGESVLGWKVNGSRKVLMLSLEMPHPSLAEFTRKIEKSFSEQQLQMLAKNFFIAPIGDTLPFDAKEGQQFLDSIMKEYMPDVLFVDSLQRTITQKMTDELAVKNLIKHISYLRNRYSCSIYMIHHNRKGQVNSGPPTLDDLYGNVFLQAELDWALTMHKAYGADHLRLENTKNRLAAERQPITIKRTDYLQFEIDASDGGATVEPYSNSHSDGITKSSGDTANGRGFDPLAFD